MHMDENKIKSNIARNISAYRKRCNLTQAQLAEKIAYSDKAISKWERAEGIPDTLVMLELCEIFGVTLNDLVADKVKKQAPFFLRNRLIITLLSISLVWLVAVVIFVILGFVLSHNHYLWLCFIYPIPVSFIVCVVFSALWGNKILRLLSISGLIWSTCLGAYMPLYLFYENSNNWLVFLIGIPVQFSFIVWFFLKRKSSDV